MHLSPRLLASFFALSSLAACTEAPSTETTASVPAAPIFKPGSTGTADGGPSVAGHDYRVTISGFSSTQELDLLRLKLVRSGGAAPLRDAKLIVDGEVSFTFPEALAPGQTFTLDYFIDEDRDGACGPPCGQGPLSGETNEPAWRRPGTGFDETFVYSAGSSTDISPF